MNWQRAFLEVQKTTTDELNNVLPNPNEYTAIDSIPVRVYPVDEKDLPMELRDAAQDMISAITPWRSAYPKRATHMRLEDKHYTITEVKHYPYRDTVITAREVHAK